MPLHANAMWVCYSRCFTICFKLRSTISCRWLWQVLSHFGEINAARRMMEKHQRTMQTGWMNDISSNRMEKRARTITPEFEKNCRNQTQHEKLNKFLIAYPWWIVFKLIFLSFLFSALALASKRAYFIPILYNQLHRKEKYPYRHTHATIRCCS